MAKKESKRSNKAKKKANAAQSSTAPDEKNLTVQERWETYIQKNTLADFQRFLGDLGFTDVANTYPSKSKCRIALEGVWVNIHDFLDAFEKRQLPYTFKFPTEGELAHYTKTHNKIYPKKVAKGSPLRQLLGHIFGRGRYGGQGVGQGKGAGLSSPVGVQSELAKTDDDAEEELRQVQSEGKDDVKKIIHDMKKAVI